MTRTLLTASLAAALLAPAASAQVAFEHVAPENSIFVAGIHNATTTRARFERTALHALWQSDEMSALRKQLTAEFDQDLKGAAGELGLDPNEIPWPAGALGFAIFPVIDPEIGMPAPAFVLFADYGDQSASFQRIVDAMIDRGKEAGNLTVEEREILNRTVFTITFAGGEDADDDWGFDDPDEDDWGFDDEWGFDDDPFGFGDPLAEFRELHFVRDGGAFILCNDLGSITEILDRLDNGRPSGLANRAEFRQMLDLLGTNDGYAMMLTRDAMNLAQALDPTGMAAMMLPQMLRSLFGEITAIGSSVLLDAPEGMVRSNYAALMPSGKRGLTSLIDVSRPRGPLPAFAGEGTFTYATFNFAFGRIADVAQQFVNDNPMLAMMGVGEQLAAIDPMIRQFTGTLGENVQMVTSLRRPMEPDSLRSIVAIEVNDPVEFDAMLAQFPMAGLVPHELNGHRVFTTAPMLPLPVQGFDAPEMAIAIGTRHVLMGPLPSIEQALSAAADPDRVGALADDSLYRAASARIPDVPLVGWGYMDAVTAVEAAIETSRQAMGPMLGQMQQDMDDPVGEIDWDVVRRYIGPSAFWIRSTDTGFVATSILLSADQASE